MILAFQFFSIRRFLLLAISSISLISHAGPSQEAEAAALALASDQENAGYMFRAEAWVGDLNKGIGKAVRMQLFKGNEYCIGVAVPRASGIHITGAVLDLDAKPVGEIQPVLDGWGYLLFFKPKKTGVYVVTIREAETGKQADTSCAIITGYK
ncbi:MAG: hypothetical protein ABL974_07455 [Prosthecobacter sp.]